MTPTAKVDYESIARRYLVDGVVAIALMGSHARGDAGDYSDIDIVRFWDRAHECPDADTHLEDGHFIVVSNVSPHQAEAWFERPEIAVTVISGLRAAIPLFDPTGVFAEIRGRALAFTWDERLQRLANDYVSNEMVGYIEEAQKGMEGLRRRDAGRLMQCRNAISWAMMKVVMIHRGVLNTTENRIIDEAVASVGPDAKWSELCTRTIGRIDEDSTPADQARAALLLYAETVRLVQDALRPEHRPLIAEVVQRIEREMALQHR